MSDLPWEEIKRQVRGRDKDKCQRTVSPGGKKCGKSQKIMHFVRVKEREPDSVKNTVMVCKKHVPLWEDGADVEWTIRA